MTEPVISVIVPHFNDVTNLATCVRLLEAQVVGEKFEIVVADNNSDCGVEFLQGLCGAGVRVIHVCSQGAAAARNGGVAASKGAILAFLDSDCRPARDWLANGLRALSSASLVGGRVIVKPADDENPTAAEAFELVFAFNNKRYIEQEKFSVTANMFVAKKNFDFVGEFRGGLSEDKEWGQRAAALGLQWSYAPDVIVEHPARHSLSELKRKWRRINRESYLLARERSLGVPYWLFRSWLIFLSTPLYLIAIARSPNLKGLKQRGAAAVLLFVLRGFRLLESHRIIAAKPDVSQT